MSQGVWFGAQAFFLVFYVWISYQLGIINDLVQSITTPPSPSSGGIIVSLIAPLIYAWNVVKVFFQFATFEPVGVPETIGIPITLFFAAVDIWIVIKLIRGN